ncbi:cysteine hydrolase family protein [Solimicrobium silvestre]|uniref:Isochorismatase family n=1 Tax=Solimicrobium silvestre TaxID=2099400 RepID=A0A2S9GVT7_9BURK|nr:cysteine hydrolase family protein [Solimicrobium silvestre]PRC91837.1 Isochorismatase family [Solimicrobium silvestre]
MKTALIVIDFQNSIFNAPPAYEVHQVMERISAVIQKARKAGVAVIYVQHQEDSTGWQAGTPDWEFPSAIAPQADDYLVHKSVASAFVDTNLLAHLTEQEIQRVYICGYATEFCIDTNVRQCASLKLNTVVISDAHTTRDRPHLSAPKIIEHHNWVWSEFGGIQLCQTSLVEFDE